MASNGNNIFTSPSDELHSGDVIDLNTRLYAKQLSFLQDIARQNKHSSVDVRRTFCISMRA